MVTEIRRLDAWYFYLEDDGLHLRNEDGEDLCSYLSDSDLMHLGLERVE